MGACNCRERINEKLAQHNTRLEIIYAFDSNLADHFSVSTVQIEKGRGKPKATAIFASYCPFCGVSLRKPATLTKQVSE